MHIINAQKVFTREQLERVMHPVVLCDAFKILRFDTTEINAGIISEDEPPQTFIFRCRNISDRRIAITRINTTCGCTEAYIDHPVMQPGDEACIKVEFNPFGHPGKSQLRAFLYSDISESQPIAILILNTEVTPSAKLWKDYRYTIGPLKLRNVVADLGKIFIDKPKSIKIACANSGSKPLCITQVKDSLPEFISLYTEPSILAPSEEGMLVIEYNGTYPVGLDGISSYEVILDGIDLPSSQRTISVSIELVK